MEVKLKVYANFEKNYATYRRTWGVETEEHDESMDNTEVPTTTTAVEQEPPQQEEPQLEAEGVEEEEEDWEEPMWVMMQRQQRRLLASAARSWPGGTGTARGRCQMPPPPPRGGRCKLP